MPTLIPIQLIYDQRINSPLTNVAGFFVPFDSTITAVRANAPNAASTRTFNLRVGHVQQWGSGELLSADSSSPGEKSGLEIPATKGQYVSIDAVGTFGTGFGPYFFEFDLEPADGAIVTADELAAIEAQFPAGAIVGTTDPQTLTNKRIDPRETTVVTDDVLTPDADAMDVFTVTALAEAAAIAEPAGTPVDTQPLIIRIVDDGNARALTFDSVYREVGAELPTTTAAGKTMYLAFFYNAPAAVWDLVAKVEQS